MFVCSFRFRVKQTTCSVYTIIYSNSLRSTSRIYKYEIIHFRLFFVRFTILNFMSETDFYLDKLDSKNVKM